MRARVAPLTDAGARAQSPVVGAFCHKLGIPAVSISAVLLNRLNGDQVVASQGKVCVCARVVVAGAPVLSCKRV